MRQEWLAAKREFTILSIVPFGMAAAWWWLHPQLLLDADSPRYLAGDPMRTATYPLFLDAFNGRFLLPLQLALFAGSLSWLALYAGRFLRLPATAALVLAIGANPYLWELQSTVMSEALTTPILTIIVGCIVGFVSTRRAAPILAAAFLCGLAATIRPPALALLIVPVSTILLAPGLDRRFRLLAVVLGFWAAPVVAERAYSRAVHGDQLSSPLGRCAFMKAAVIDAPRTVPRTSDPLDRLLVNALNDDFAPVRRTIAAAPNWHIRYILLTNYETCAAWPCGDLILKDVQRPRPDIDRALFNAGIDRLKGNPAGYLQLSVTEYFRMWLLHPRKHPDLALEYNAFLAGASPLPFQHQLLAEGRPTPPEEVSPAMRLNRVIFASVGILAALLTIVAAAFHRAGLSRMSLPLLLGGQAILVLSALTAVGLPRYAMGVWPVIIAGILLAGLALLDVVRAQRSGKGTKRESG